ncbi:MAG: methyltransferase domain-containing protein [Candidatus Heimdallarchaeota archaeon]|nr:MAG: methyltransferase domain-containing protein [Candidatus Heimdallarchaeota archaeon]
MRTSSDEEIIIHKENKLRAWFTQGLSEKDRIIDGFDIGWGGTARWATSLLAEHLVPHKNLAILDVACGYGTFLVELGWRFPLAELIGLNLDFDPPHNNIVSLLSQGEVKAHLISADALQLPLISEKFDCVSCFLGLQDIIITRGKESLVDVVSELLRTVSHQGFLTLLDNFSKQSFENILSQQSLEYDLVFHDSFKPNCQWSREVGLKAVEMYAQGYLQQQLDSNNPPDDNHKALTEIRKKMLSELENQLETQGYYNPWGIMRLVLLQRL